MSDNEVLTQDDVLEALRDVYDPEIPVNIVDLGLVYLSLIHISEPTRPY